MDRPLSGRRRDASRIDPVRIDPILIAALVVGLLVGLVRAEPWPLQGAALEALVERGRLSFAEGEVRGPLFRNDDTPTPEFRVIVNVFPHDGVYRINHAPGQFWAAAPVYALASSLGLRFATRYDAAWAVLVWGFLAPLAAAATWALARIARSAGATAPIAAGIAAAAWLASPLWAASGVLYHDALAIQLLLLGGAASVASPASPRARNAVALAGGLATGFSVVVSYLVVPLALALTAAAAVTPRAAVPGMRQRTDRHRRGLFVIGSGLAASALLVWNFVTLGHPLSTGYSAGGFDANYPAASLDNFLAKLWFYLGSREYGLLALFPLFALGAVGWLLPGLDRRMRAACAVAAGLHLAFIASMPHHGDSGWGMGRFFLPLFPLLALGLVGVLATRRQASHPGGPLGDSSRTRAHQGIGAAFGATAGVSLLHATLAARHGLWDVPGGPTRGMVEDLSARWGASYTLAVLAIGAVGAGIGWVAWGRRGPDRTTYPDQTVTSL